MERFAHIPPEAVLKEDLLRTGIDFDSLREYAPDEDVRHIDWNVTARLDQPQFVAHDIFERRALALCVADQEPGYQVRHFEQPLRDADVDHDDAGHQLRLYVQRRQQGAVARQRRAAFRQVEYVDRVADAR